MPIRALWRPATWLLTAAALPLLDRRIEESVKPFTRPQIMLPHNESRRFAWTHYGFFVPELPPPYRYLNTMTLIGAPGAVCFDNDYLVTGDARHTATVLSSTAAERHHHYRAYDIRAECAFDRNGARLQFGKDLKVRNNFPTFAVAGRYEGMSVDLAISATDEVAWFVRNPLYDHFSLLARFNGTISDTHGTSRIEGLCTVEYARCVGPQSLTGTPIPEPLKIPVDFFTYQIVNLDADTQLLLTDVRAAGATACRLAYIRSVAGSSVYDDVRLEVLSYRDEPLVDEQGRSMRVPDRLRWMVRERGREVVSFEATVDSELRYGHGRGYVGAYSYAGRWNGRDIGGSGYLEWVDCEPS